MEISNEISNILTQVKETSIVINVHATGYFISKRQFEALERHILDSTPGETEEDPFEGLNRKLALLQERRAEFSRQLRFEADPSKKTALNLAGQRIDSEIAKVNRILNGTN